MPSPARANAAIPKKKGKRFNMPPIHSTNGESLADVVERVLDKGLVINADIVINLCKTELLSIKLRAALASFETAAKWGLAFPSDVRIGPPVGLPKQRSEP